MWDISENAVKSQIWIAISVYVLVAIVKKRFKLNLSLYNFLQILSISMFEKTPIYQLVANIEKQEKEDRSCNQLDLFDI